MKTTTRLAFISDSHIGAGNVGYHMQPAYPNDVAAVVHALAGRLAAAGGVDALIHGGDMVDAADCERILQARERFALPIPVHLCLGNHDLTSVDALPRWLQHAPDFFPDGAEDWTLHFDNCVVHAVTTQWGPTPYAWIDVQQPHFLAPQFMRLRQRLATRTDVPHVLVTHAPTAAVPPGQTGNATPFHPPRDEFVAAIAALTAEFPHLRLILGGHNYVNTCIWRTPAAVSVTAAAFWEVPFEFKLLEFSPGRITMTTVPLAGNVGFATDYDFDRTFVQGRSCDRAFDLSW